jgi:hypothetical protein
MEGTGIMKRITTFFLILVLMGGTAGTAASEEITREDFDERRNRINAAGMLTLGSWALANIGVNTALYFATEEDIRYFYEMNVLWNVVNLGIAGLGYWGAVRAEPSEDLFGSVDAQYGLEKALLFNAGLDTAYMMTGLFLMEHAGNASSNQARFRGYGQSLLLQGGFLLVFDLVMYAVQRRSRSLLEPLLDG